MMLEHGGKGDHGPVSESMDTVRRVHVNTGLVICDLTAYYLPTYPPYDDYNWCLDITSTHVSSTVTFRPTWNVHSDILPLWHFDPWTFGL